MRLFHAEGKPIELKITSYPIKNKRLLNGRVAYLLYPINGYKVFCIDIIKESYYLEDEKGNKTHFQQVPLEANISFLEKKGITIEPNYPRMTPLEILKIASLLPINDSMSPLPKG